MLLARRALLVIVAFVFAAIAIASRAMPDTMADGLGYRLDNIDAQNEYSAIYVGLWLATCAIFVSAARKPEDRSLYMVCVLLLAGQTVGRVLSVVIDGVPSVKTAPAFVVEAIGVVALLALRPRSPTRSPA